MKRLGVIVAIFTALLVIRTLVAPPVAIVSLTADDLKAWLCKTDWWDHSFTISKSILASPFAIKSQYDSRLLPFILRFEQ